MTDPGRRPLQILLATDDSPPARDAESWALRLRAAGAERRIDVVTIAHGTASLGWSAQTYRPAVREAIAGLREAELRAAERLANEIGERLQHASGTTVRTWARAGDTAQELLALVAETDPDLVAIGHRSRSHLAELVLGSVALRVLAEAPCPVLVARGCPDAVPAPSRAAIVLDDIEAAEADVARLAALGVLDGAAVALLHLLDSFPESGSGNGGAATLAARREAALERMAAELTSRGANVTVTAARGDPVAALQSFVRGKAPELLVASRGLPYRAGSLADRLVHESGRSVIVVPPA